MISSFTRAAAVEIAERATGIPHSNVGTLHSFAFRALEGPEIAQAHMADWNKRYRHWSIGGAGIDLDDAGFDPFAGATDGERLLVACDNLRNRRIPEEGWPKMVRAFYKAWCDWKETDGFVDFTDLIEIALEEADEAPGNPRVMMIDEAQDNSVLENALLRKWAKKTDTTVAVGDDDQASLRGTKVLCYRDGREMEVPIESLDPHTDRLICYNKEKSHIDRNGGAGYKFETRTSPYRGTAIRVEADGRVTRCTANHKWFVKITDRLDLKVTYLMRKGDYWRVGWCQYKRADGTEHLGVRAHLEDADEMWILRVHESATEASIYESYVAAKWGIPTVPFLARQHPGNRSLYSQDSLDWLFETLGDTTSRARRCLSTHSRLIEYPYWKKDTSNKYGATIRKIIACNLHPLLHTVPIKVSSTKVEWCSVNLEYREIDEIVYSIGVDPHENYVADGMVTGNCLYLFRGVTTDSFLGWEVPNSNVKVLSQSYRVPAKVHALAVAWIKRVANRAEKNYEPREGAEGQVDITHGRWNGGEKVLVDLAEETASKDQTVMILASCGFMLEPIVHELRDRGLPFHNPYRVKRGDWNPLGTRRGTSIVDRLLAYLRPDNEAWGEMTRIWNAQDLKDWTDPLRAKGILKRGAKRYLAEIAEGSARPLDMVPTPPGVLSFFEEDVWHLLMETDLDWWAENLLAEHKKRAAYPVRVAKQQGIPALRSRPKIVVGTIHSVKGAECQPPWSQVLTTNRGYVPISDLNPSRDKVVSFNNNHHKIHRGGPKRWDGYGFEIRSREYDGELLTIKTSQSSTDVTPNHRITVRWSKHIHDKYAVYLMRRGNWYRIGMTQMFHGKTGQVGLKMRARMEGAEALWLLGLFDTMNEALFHEQLWGRTFQVPDLNFELPWSSGNQLTSEQLRTIWNSAETKSGAIALLNSLGLNHDYPLITFNRKYDGTHSASQFGMRNRFTIRACNLIEDAMRLPTDPGSGQTPDWLPFRIERTPYTGQVYRLTVERWGHYISDGAVVHNSDHVIICPDLSQQGMNEWESGREKKEAVMRQFYVGMTRARERLTVTQLSGRGVDLAAFATKFV